MSEEKKTEEKEAIKEESSKAPEKTPAPEAPPAEPAEAAKEEAPAAETPKEEPKPEAPKRESVQGKVKWFSNVKGFGFLVHEGGEKDVFIHYSAIQSAGYKTLDPDEEVTFEIEEGEKGPHAVNVIRSKKKKGAESKGKEGK